MRVEMFLISDLSKERIYKKESSYFQGFTELFQLDVEFRILKIIICLR